MLVLSRKLGEPRLGSAMRSRESQSSRSRVTRSVWASLPRPMSASIGKNSGERFARRASCRSRPPKRCERPSPPCKRRGVCGDKNLVLHHRSDRPVSVGISQASHPILLPAGARATGLIRCAVKFTIRGLFAFNTSLPRGEVGRRPGEGGPPRRAAEREIPEGPETWAKAKFSSHQGRGGCPGETGRLVGGSGPLAGPAELSLITG